MADKSKKTGAPLTKTLAEYWGKYSYIFVFILILIVYAFTINANGNRFNPGHISGILSSQNTVIVGTMAIGMAMVIITGQIDLSLGSSLVLCTGVTILTYNATGGNVLCMILAALGSGLVCGTINGVLVGYAKMPPFIVTLGTMLIYRSLTLSVVREIDPALTGSSSSQFSMISDMASYDFLRMKFGTGSLRIGTMMIPYISFLFVALTLFFIFMMSNTKYGKSIYAVGSNEKTARLTGINVEAVKVSVFSVTGLLVGVASFIQACKIGNVTPASSGTSYEMYAIAAVVLGGVNMAGGRGKILGVFFGALSYTTINFIIVSIPALSPDIQNTFQGLVLITVILVQTAGPVIKEKFTAVLTESEAAQLITVMKRIAESGIAIIFITHRLDEVMAASNSITILRDGKLVATRKVEETSIVELAELMIGRKGEAVVDAQPRISHSDRVALHLGDLKVDMPGEAVRGVTLDVYEGEIFGIGGLAGQGKLGIPNGVMGLYDTEGTVELFGESLKVGDTNAALHAGIAMVSEDRKGVGLLLDQSIEDNIVFNAMQVRGDFLKKFGPFTLKNAKAIRDEAEKMIQDLDIRCFGPTQASGTLSGGNQQKVCIARALCMNPKFLFVSEPTRGIDIGAKKLVLETLVKLNREQGMTVVIVSSELQELRSISDRIAIVSEGKLVEILAPDASDADFGLAMSGIKPSEHNKKEG